MRAGSIGPPGTSDTTSAPMRRQFVRHTYGLKANQVKAVMYRNDVDDLDAVIEFLEQRGK